MPVAYRDKIARVPGVQIMVNQWFGGIYKEPKNMFARFASEPDRLFTACRNQAVTEEQRAFIADRTGCIIGKDTAAKYNIKIGDRMTLKGDILPVNLDLTVRGIYDYPLDNENDVLQRSVPI